MGLDGRLIEFRFKGDRDYIHGTDMFNALLGAFDPSEVRDIRFVIHGFVRAPRCKIYEAGSKDQLSVLEDVKVRATFERGGVVRWLALKNADASGAGRRYEYREEKVTSLCRIEPGSIVLAGTSPYTFIETVVAMNKHMHQTLFPAAAGRWLFTGIDLARGCAAREQIALRIGRDVNYRLTRAEVVYEGHAIGNVFFSLSRQ